MNRFMKSLLVGMVVSLVVIGGIAGAGLWLSRGTHGPVASVVNDDAPRLVRMRPQTVHLGGYSLNSNKQAKVLLISVAMTVTGGQNQAKVCRLMPRLVSTLNTAFANLASYGGDVRVAASKGLTAQLRQGFNRALGEALVSEVSLTAYENKADAPGSNCPEET